jgi:hypothetical protein
MSVNLKPLRWDLPAVTVGDTFPAINFQFDGEGTLLRVRAKIKDVDGALQLTMDSETTGMTINTATDGAWDFDLDVISDAVMETLDAGIHFYDLEYTSSTGTVRTLLSGQWEILSEITD